MPVPRCSPPDLETFAARFGRPGLPVVIRGAADGWAARVSWSVDAFAARFSSLEVNVSRNDSPSPATRSLSLGDYVRYCREDAHADDVPWYLASWRFIDACPDLRADFETPPWFRDDWLSAVPAPLRPTLLWMFIGPPRAGSWLHLDVAHTSAWNVQITGHKRWILFPPGQDACLYSGRVNAFAPDLRRFPDFAQAHAYVADVGPGDLLYTPTGWWHQTFSLEEGIALTGNVANAWNADAVAAWLDQHPLALAAEGLTGLAAAFRQVMRDRRAG